MERRTGDGGRMAQGPCRYCTVYGPKPNKVALSKSILSFLIDLVINNDRVQSNMPNDVVVMLMIGDRPRQNRSNTVPCRCTCTEYANALVSAWIGQGTRVKLKLNEVRSVGSGDIHQP